MTNRKVILTPEIFKVNENGEVLISDAQLVEQIEKATDEMSASEQGIKISLSMDN
ncbi:hypothetical protein [Rossellomorea aquimaris]|uniref:hypothetical protein n=1 Tax=Rossellomorea aquimaris TaxID=189382 RepID=UPI000B1C4068|nr:hypothetical protein [Rossellomorea aquimaris]